MWAMITRIALRLAALRWLFKLGGLGLLLPLVLLLKTIGLPLLMILAVVALPVLLLLFLFGLPVFMVFIAGSLVMGLLAMLVTIGVAALKFAVFVVLPIWLIWSMSSTAVRWAFRRRHCRDDEGGEPAAEPPAGGSEL